MPIVEINPRETKKLVHNGGNWYVEAINQGILTHTAAPRVRDSGREIERGRQAHVELERFNEDTLYGWNPSQSTTARIRVDRQNFELNLFPRRAVESATEAAARNDQFQDAGFANQTVPTGGAATNVGGHTNNSGDLQIHVLSTFGFRDSFTPDLLFALSIDDETGSNVLSFPTNPHSPQITVAAPIKPGWEANLVARNNSGSDVTIDTQINYRNA
jgi:hypothetical protein